MQFLIKLPTSTTNSIAKFANLQLESSGVRAWELEFGLVSVYVGFGFALPLTWNSFCSAFSHLLLFNANDFFSFLLCFFFFLLACFVFFALCETERSLHLCLCAARLLIQLPVCIASSFFLLFIDHKSNKFLKGKKGTNNMQSQIVFNLKSYQSIYLQSIIKIIE